MIDRTTQDHFTIRTKKRLKKHTLHPSLYHHLFLVSLTIHNKITYKVVSQSYYNIRKTIVQTLSNHEHKAPFISQKLRN